MSLNSSTILIYIKLCYNFSLGQRVLSFIGVIIERKNLHALKLYGFPIRDFGNDESSTVVLKIPITLDIMLLPCTHVSLRIKC